MEFEDDDEGGTHDVVSDWQQKQKGQSVAIEIQTEPLYLRSIEVQTNASKSRGARDSFRFVLPLVLLFVFRHTRLFSSRIPTGAN